MNEPHLIDDAKVWYFQQITSVTMIDRGVDLGLEHELLRIVCVRPDWVSLAVSRGKKFDPRASHAVVDVEKKSFPVTVDDQQDSVTLRTSEFILHISKLPFRMVLQRHDGSIVCESALAEDGSSRAYGVDNDLFVVNRKKTAADGIYGLGEKTGASNRNGRNLILWNNDVLAPEINPEISILPEGHSRKNKCGTDYDPYYVSIPFFYHRPVHHRHVGGFFIDNCQRGLFEFSNAHTLRFGFQGGHYRESIFVGPKMDAIIASYTLLTGRMQRPPKWALGYHQCRWFRYNAQQLTDLAQEFRQRNIPCDSLWLDIDYMDGYRVFSWDKALFPDPSSTFKLLQHRGFDVVTIIDPGVKLDATYEVYQEAIENDHLCYTASGDSFTGRVWPGRTVFPDFSKISVRNWWGRWCAKHLCQGISGIWNDMNEPATGDVDAMVFDHDGRPANHASGHNQYGLLMAMATLEGFNNAQPQTRPFVLSRAGSAGIQRMAANWTGDNCSDWQHLRQMIPMCLGVGLSGQPFIGADVGGFLGACTGELLARWMQAAALMPFFRNHSSHAQPQYPWSFGPLIEETVRQAIALRYCLMPYLYHCFVKASQTGCPVQQALYYAFPEDPMADDCDDQFMLGEHLMVAPILERGCNQRRVYFPQGEWICWHSQRCMKGPSIQTVSPQFTQLPLFVRAGAIIPCYRIVPQSTKQPTEIIFKVFVGQEAVLQQSFWIEDDGVSYDYRRGLEWAHDFTVVVTPQDIGVKHRKSGQHYNDCHGQTMTLAFVGSKVATKQRSSNLEIHGQELDIIKVRQGFDLKVGRSK